MMNNTDQQFLSVDIHEHMNDCWMNILNQAIVIGTHVFKYLNIPAGSYTAADVHRALTQKKGSYTLKHADFLYTKTTGDDKYDPIYNYCHRLESGSLTTTVLTPKIFHALMNYEKIVRIKPKDRHIWVKESQDTLAGSITVVFPPKNVVQKIPSLMNGLLKRNSECVVFFPTKNRLQIVSENYIAFDYVCEIKGRVELPEIAFRFNTTTLKHIYGSCTVDYYIDKKGQYSLLITNEQGWKTSLYNYLSELEMKTLSNISKALEAKTYDNTIAPLIKRFNNDHKISPSKLKSMTKGDNIEVREASVDIASNVTIPSIQAPESKPDIKDVVAAIFDETTSIKDTLTIRSADNQNEINMQNLQKAQLLLPYRKLSCTSVIPSREGSIKQTLPLLSSPVINHLCIQIEIVQMDHIRKLYGEGKLRVDIKKASNGGCNNPLEISLLIQTADGWIVDNRFLRYKSLTPISMLFPAPQVEGRTATLPNHLSATCELIGTGSLPAATIQKTVLGLPAPTELRKDTILPTHTLSEEDIEHSVKILQMSRTYNE